MPTKILTKASFHLNEDWLKKNDEEWLLVRTRHWAMWIVDREVGAGPAVALDVLVFPHGLQAQQGT